MKRKYDLYFFVFGVALAVSGLILLQNHNASAASQDYTEDYTVTKWRNLDFYYASIPPAKTVSTSVGPSQWSVAGTIGTTTYSEVWSATSWKDNTNVTDVSSPNSSVSFSESSTYASGGCFGVSFCVRTSGLYGASIIHNPSSTATFKGSPSSIPEKWHVTGTIITP